MRVNIQVQADLSTDTRTMANVEAAVSDAMDAVAERLGMNDHLASELYGIRGRVETEVVSHGETITVRKNVAAGGFFSPLLVAIVLDDLGEGGGQ